MRHEHKTSGLDRRSFLKAASTVAAGAGAYFSLGGLADAFAWVPGAAPTDSVWPPLSQSRAFEMLVFGDSIMWGQGHQEHQKFSYKVQKWLESKMPGTEVHRHVFAHSGAQILASEEKDARPATHGEVPNNFPSITAQVAFAIDAAAQQRYIPSLHGPLTRESVALVLIDGGINDFGTKKILTPDPTVGADWVRKITREQTVTRLKKLLPLVLTNFPNAKIVVTNYFQIVSDQSDPVYLWELLRAWEVIGPAITGLSGPLMSKLTAQALAFHDESTKGFREAVAEARPLEVVASAATSSAGAAKVGALQGRAEAMDFQRKRIALAEVPFGPRNAYGAPETYLFYVNEPDPAASVRKPACMALSSVPDPNCLLAAAGHPNAKGEEAYFQAIKDTLIRLAPELDTPVKVEPKVPVRLPGRRIP